LIRVADSDSQYSYLICAGVGSCFKNLKLICFLSFLILKIFFLNDLYGHFLYSPAGKGGGALV